MRLLIKNAIVVAPTGSAQSASITENAELYVENGQFVRQLSDTPTETIDAKGAYLIPGLVDLRARFREPGLEHKANIRKEALAAAKSGITSVAIPPDTDPVIDRPSMVQMLIEKGNESGGAKIHPIAALTRRLEGEKLSDMSTLTHAGSCGVSNARSPIPDALVMRRAMQYAASFDLRVHLNAQDHTLAGNGCIHEGATSTRLGLPAIPVAAEIVGVAREIALVETTGVKAHFMGLSCARSVEMIADAQSRGFDITADVDIHHLLMSEEDTEDFDTNYFVLPPLRTKADQQALIDGVKSGVISAICSDHQPHDKDAKLAPYSDSEPGISAIDHLLPLAFELIEDGVLPLETAISALTRAPASILGIDAGTLSEGASADFCLVEKAASTLTADTMLSSGKNSPYIGRSSSYRLKQCFIDGELV